jgi:hypothetical protein
MSIEDFDCPMCGSEIQLTLLSIVIIKMGRKGDALTNEFISRRKYSYERNRILERIYR